jgi:hypothetical protein
LANLPSADLQHEPRSRRLSPKTRWIPYAIIAIVVIPILWLAIHAFVAYDALMNLEGDVNSLEKAASTDQFQALPYIYTDMKNNAATAASATSDPVWTAIEGVPVLGPNLAAVRGIAKSINQLVVQGVGPVAAAAKGFDIGQFRPVHGQINMTEVKSFVPAVNNAYNGILAAQKTGNAIDTTHTLGPVTSAVQSFRQVVETGVLDVNSVRKVVRLVPPALGSVTPQNYLVVMGTNSTDRANGGLAAALSLVRIDNGKVTITRSVPASSLDPSTATPPLAATPPFVAPAASSISDAERSPAFPSTAAAIASAWTAKYGDHINSVISTDTAGLGYIANAAGPVSIGNGAVVSRASIARYLDSGVYAKGFSASQVADQQSSALASTLANVIAGNGQTAAYVTVAMQLLDERRLQVWSADGSLQKFFATTPFSGTLSDSNAKVTTYGVFVNADSSTANSSRSIKMTAKATPVGCLPSAKTTSNLSTTLKSSAAGDITEDVVFYSPVDFTYSKYAISGGTVLSSTSSTIGHRAVQAFRVEIPASSKVTLSVDYHAGGPTPSPTVEVRTTPRWDVTAIDLVTCTP